MHKAKKKITNRQSYLAKKQQYELKGFFLLKKAKNTSVFRRKDANLETYLKNPGRIYEEAKGLIFFVKTFDVHIESTGKDLA